MVLVYSDDKALAAELLHAAQDLGKELNQPTSAIIIGKDDGSKELLAYGADQVFVIASGLSSFKAEEYAAYLSQLLKETKEDILLIGSNKNGKELAPRLAALFDTGCITDCTNVYIKNKKLTTERIVYSGNAIAIEQFSSTPQIVTIPSKVYDPLSKDASRSGKVIQKQYTVDTVPSKITNVQALKSEEVNVEDAEIIVSCGRGFKKKEDIKLVNDLADALKGKTVGCSRPISADLKWLSEDHWIGLSGHKVKPKLYIAAGISGQIQHIAGMRDAGIIVAINKDPEALIFKSADYGIVGDLYQVLPKLTSAIKQKMG